MGKKVLTYYFFFVVVLLNVGCNTRQPQYTIGVSQCFDDAWRQKMNAEMEREVLLHPNMSLTKRIAYGSDEVQCAQIDSFIRERVDLLIVSPNTAEEVRPAVTRAYRAGIPVIVADRRVPGEDWTAFIGGDNYQVGQLMAEWIRTVQAETAHPLHVLEVSGLQGSSPEALRHKGMMEGLESGQQSAVIGQQSAIRSIDGATDAYHAVREYLNEHRDVDAIVAQNDLMAVAAADAVRDSKYDRHVRIMGVDGIIVGLQAIVDGKIECTAEYPSRGDLLIQTAAHVLAGEPFTRDTVLETVMIDAASAHPLLRQYQANIHDQQTLRIVQLQSDIRWQKMHTERMVMIGVIVLVGLLFFFALAIVIYMQRRMQAKIKRDILPQLEEVQEAIQLSHRDVAFAERLKQLIDDHLTDPNLSVEYLAEALQIDRTQLFRRVKAIVGKGPMEYIREQRLIRANEMLRNTDKTVKQIARELCFSNPGYFSKYYKEYYGHLPGQR